MSQIEQEGCPHDNTEYDPGNYVPGFGWELHPGIFCLDCGEEIEAEYITEDIQWDTSGESTRYELEDEARNPL